MTLILIPVLWCIVLSILWVKIARSPDAGGYAPSAINYVGGGTMDGGTGSPVEGLVNAMIILSQVIVATIIILILFKYNCMKVLFGFFALVVLVLLGLFGYLLLAAILTRLNIGMDWITFALCLWNLAMVGLVSIFYKGPLWIQQAYLVVMSSLMAFSFTGLDEWTTWLLLGLLAIWDLVAVLAPFGPLRLLIESSRQNNREIPALLYSAAVWLMASLGSDPVEDADPSPAPAAADLGDDSPSPDPASNAATVSAAGVDTTLPALLKTNSDISLDSTTERQIAAESSPTTDPTSAVLLRPIRPESPDHPSDAGSANSTSHLAPERTVSRVHPLEGLVSEEELEGRAGQGESLPSYNAAARQRGPTDGPAEEEDEEDAARSGLKLGLGDFVFYSVMVSRAAMRDWVTTICVSLAAISGLISTIFLLVLFRKALPALPISIALGIIFYFASTAVVVPWVLEGFYGGVPWNAGMAEGMRNQWEAEGVSLFPGMWTGGVVYA
ncbi:Presenilin-domain-containing protein [Hyaloraphidium curvatum]|nr:Presenilin-domain-containing protein [Hyaloraphidium curvatum]